MIKPLQPSRIPANALLWLALAAIAITLIFLSGCASSKSKYDGRLSFRVAPDGAVDFERDTQARGETIAPGNAAGPSTLDAGEGGVRSSIAGNWQVELDRLASSRPELFIWTAIGLLLIAVGCFIRGWVKSGLIILAAAFLAGIFPSILSSWLPVAVGVLLVIGGIVAVVYYVLRWRGSRRATDAFAKLVKEGKDAEAVAALRAGMPAVDEAFKGAPKK